MTGTAAPDPAGAAGGAGAAEGGGAALSAGAGGLSAGASPPLHRYWEASAFAQEILADFEAGRRAGHPEVAREHFYVLARYFRRTLSIVHAAIGSATSGWRWPRCATWSSSSTPWAPCTGQIPTRRPPPWRWRAASIGE